MYSFERARKEWSNPPDGNTHTSSAEILKLNDAEFKRWVDRQFNENYSQPSNCEGKYRKALKLDDTSGRRIMDFGCGMGFDALSYARMGNEIILADISESNLELAKRVLNSEGYDCETTLVGGAYPYFADAEIDIFHSSGVMHHIPYAADIFGRVADVLKPGGEMRLMLYTMQQFLNFTGHLPSMWDVTDEPMYDRFVKTCDPVGFYADWYDIGKLLERVPPCFELVEWTYLRPDSGNVAARLIRRGV